eukprot:CAMPEP_0115046478 /NCGR_PEP_ID=MMETSP0216-20121206/48770_1 /TAXON_ID=223996 /ORGANISM="Protocruzia adherens, Strain Boccale" /LENGTH=581 /DNA_ID=CAMNT_0002429561 /DNA_START=73 /DNA_END=1818 /DNA_ORIENTATION=+
MSELAPERRSSQRTSSYRAKKKLKSQFEASDNSSDQERSGKASNDKKSPNKEGSDESMDESAVNGEGEMEIDDRDQGEEEEEEEDDDDEEDETDSKPQESRGAIQTRNRTIDYSMKQSRKGTAASRRKKYPVTRPKNKKDSYYKEEEEDGMVLDKSGKEKNSGSKKSGKEDGMVLDKSGKEDGMVLDKSGKEDGMVLDKSGKEDGMVLDKSGKEDGMVLDKSGKEDGMVLDKSGKEKNSGSKGIDIQPVASFLYRPGVPLPNLAPYIQNFIEIRVAAEYLSKGNKYFQKRSFWGNENYTSDSDIVCIVHHSGLMKIEDFPPNRVEGISVYCRVTRPRNNYASSAKHGLKSRKCQIFSGHSIKPESIKTLEDLGSREELIEMAARMPSIVSKKREKSKRIFNNFRYIPEQAMVFNLSLEPCFEYSLAALGDQGMDPSDWASFRLKDHILYLETDSERYEIAREADNPLDTEESSLFKEFETFRISKVIDPLSKDNEWVEGQPVPLDSEHVEILKEGVDWEQIQFGNSSIGNKYNLEIRRLGTNTIWKFVDWEQIQFGNSSIGNKYNLEIRLSRWRIVNSFME